MPESPIPAYVDTRKVFLQQDKISGSIDLGKLPRFRDSLANQQGKVAVVLRFSVNESRQRLIKGSLTAEVEVTCQRCLEPIGIQLQDDISLAVLEEEASAAKLDPQFDPWVCTDQKLILAELVEEQLMLCMPIVNYHDDKACLDKLNYQQVQHELEGEQPEESADNPFAVLKALKE